MINFAPLRFTRPNPRLDAFVSTVDTLNTRYDEGEALSNEAKDLFGLYKTAPSDIGIKNQFAQEQAQKIDNLLKQYEGAYEDRRFQTEAKRLVREGASDPRLAALDQTKKEYEFAENLRRQSQANPEMSLLFDNFDNIRTTIDENGNPIAGKYTGETQADWIGEAKKTIGNIAPDFFEKMGIKSLDGLLGIGKVGSGGVSNDKLEKISKNLATPFLETPAGNQWLRYQEEKVGRPLTEEEQVIMSTKFLVDANANQLSNKSSMDWSYISDLNKKEEESKGRQEYGQSVKYKVDGANYDTSKGLEYTGSPKSNYGTEPFSKAGFWLQDLFTGKSWKVTNFDSKNEDYRKDVNTAIEAGLGRDPKQLLNTIKSGTPEEIENSLMGLGINIDDVINNISNQNQTVNTQRGGNISITGKPKSKQEMLSELSSKIKTVEDLYSSKLGVALAEGYRDQYGEINEAITISPDYSKESEAVDKEKMTARVKAGRPMLEISNGNTRIINTDEVDDLEIGEDLMYSGPVDKYNIIAGKDQRFVKGDLYQSSDGKQYIIGKGNINEVPLRDRAASETYAKLRTNYGREVDIPNSDIKGKMIISEPQLRKSLSEWENSIDPTTSYEVRAEMKLKAQAALRSGKELVLIKDSKGRVKIEEIKILLDNLY